MEPKPPFITLHSHVLVALIETSGESEQREFTLVTSQQADFQSGLLDESTPLARALLGHTAGDVIPYKRGDLKQICVLKVDSAGPEVSAEGAKKRRRNRRLPIR